MDTTPTAAPDTAARPHRLRTSRKRKVRLTLRKLFIPLLLVEIGVTVWAGWLVGGGLRERQRLGLVYGSQQAQVDRATKARTDLDNLSVDVRGLGLLRDVEIKRLLDDMASRIAYIQSEEQRVEVKP